MDSFQNPSDSVGQRLTSQPSGLESIYNIHINDEDDDKDPLVVIITYNDWHLASAPRLRYTGKTLRLFGWVILLASMGDKYCVILLFL